MRKIYSNVGTKRLVLFYSRGNNEHCAIWVTHNDFIVTINHSSKSIVSSDSFAVLSLFWNTITWKLNNEKVCTLKECLFELLIKLTEDRFFMIKEQFRVSMRSNNEIHVFLKVKEKFTDVDLSQII